MMAIFENGSNLLWSQLWQVTLVALLVGAAVALFCRQRPHLAYLLWILVVIKCLTPPVIASPTSVFSWLGLQQEASIENEVALLIDGAESKNDLPDETSSQPIPLMEEDASDSRDSLATGAVPAAEVEVKQASRKLEGNGFDARRALMLLWFSGTLAIGSITLISVLRIWWRGKSESSDASRAQELADEICQELGLRRSVRVAISVHGFGPAVFGLYRPTVILPAELALEAPRQQLSTVLRHELTHVRRGDTWVGALQVLTQLLWWFHPLVWWVNRRVTIERERCCDREVLAETNLDPAQYAQCLLDVARQKQRHSPWLALPAVRSADVTRRRLHAILDYDSSQASRPRARDWAIMLAGCLLLLPGGGLMLSAADKRRGDSQGEPVTRTEARLPQPLAGTWPQAGGTSHRNNVSLAPVATKWDVKSGENILWNFPPTPAKSTQWWGTSQPVVGHGKVLFGANNIQLQQRHGADEDLACLICVDENSGEFLWQHANERLVTGRVNDWPMLPILSTPLIQADRAWYVNNRSEVVCLDMEGFRDNENDGAKDETHVETDDADVIWKFDMIKELGAAPHHRTQCSLTAAGDLLLIPVPRTVTIPNASFDANTPSFIAIHKTTGKVVWKDWSVPAENILDGQWGSAAMATIDGVPQAIFPGGDGWLYAFDVRKMARGKSKLLWKFDCNPKDATWHLGGSGTRNQIIAPPVIYKDRVYVNVGQDIEHGEGIGHLWCIDPTRRGDLSAELVVKVDDPTHVVPHRRLKPVNKDAGEMTIPNPNEGVVWHYYSWDRDGDAVIDFEEQMNRSVASVTIKDDLLFAADYSGSLHCIDARTGIRHWIYDTFANLNSAPLIAGDHVYVGDWDGDICVFELSKQMTMVGEFSCRSSVHVPMTAVGNKLFMQTAAGLCAISDRAMPADNLKPARNRALKNQDVGKLTIRWKADVGRALQSSAAMAGDQVFVGNRKGDLHSLSRKTGAVNWKTHLGDAIEATPTHYRGRVFASDVSGKCFAVDATNGKVLWTHDSGAVIQAPALVQGNRLWQVNNAGSLLCLDGGTGAVKYKIVFGDQLRATPTLFDGELYLPCCDGKLYVVQADTGKIVRSCDMETGTLSSPAVTEEMIVVGTEVDVRAFDRKSCKLLWSVESESSYKEFRSSPVLTKSLAVIGSNDSHVYGIRLNSGKIAWKFKTKDSVETSPLVLGNRIVVGSQDGRVYRIQDGLASKSDAVEIGSQVLGTLAHDQDGIIATTMSGSVVCLEW